MRRLPAPLARPRALTVWPAAVAGTIALALSGENAAHAAPPAPALAAVPPAPRTLGLPVLTAVPAASTYTVQPGDTVWAIARAHGLDTAAMLAANGLDAGSVIRPGHGYSRSSPRTRPRRPPPPRPAPTRWSRATPSPRSRPPTAPPSTPS
ncbi:LysM peptidoglycan-binding domain-containing protein [Microbacterium sp. SLBN-111]|uniref:LysM peptidoglycan-binding domain-containing protein n=1 Tax=Microbacterium sp. SLBN-111 TaxID=3377733 RepID=UPI003C765554